MTGVKLGVNVRFKNPPRFARDWAQVYREHLEYAAAADRLGFDAVWVPEHHGVPSGYNPTPLMILAAIAQVTKKVSFGIQPLILPFHNPVLAAEQIAVLDVLSGGRVIMGVGIGFLRHDFLMLGKDRTKRGAMMDEALAILTRALWDETPFDFEGRFYSHREINLTPRPLQKKVELQLAIRSEAAAKRVAQHEINVNLQGFPTAARIGPVVAEIAAKAGRDPGNVGAGVQRTGFILESEQRARDRAFEFVVEDGKEYDRFMATSSDPPDRELIAIREALRKESPSSAEIFPGAYSAQALIDAIHSDIEGLKKAGLRPDWINLSLWPPGLPLADALECLERVANEVLPHVPRAKTAACAR